MTDIATKLENPSNHHREPVVMIGLDGMPYGLMHRFAHDGTMPNLGALAEQSVFRQMASSIPEVSSVAWSSVITGANPGEHGVFGFTDVAPGTYRMTFPNYSALKAPPFWEREGSGRAVIINVPTTFPARPMNGVHIAGFVALDLERATYPASLVPVLEEMDYRVDVDSQKAHETLGFFLRDLEKTLDARIAAYRHLWQQAWETFVLVFTGTDRLAHFLWDAYEDPSHRYHRAFRDHFRRIDGVIGEIAESLAEEDVLIMLSDHGFERLRTDVYVNYVLQQAGFLAFEEGQRPGLKAIADGTRAFALDPGRIYVNQKGRFPRGGVEPEARDAVVDELIDLFQSLEREGEPVIKHVFRAEELYRGPQLHAAPDVVLLGESGFNLRGNWRADAPFGTGIFTGKHSQADAFLLVHGQGAEEAVPEEPSVMDVVGIMDVMRKA
jgi:predicted AlkP superfamily phosphohydrolase/phosphomutase